MSFEINHPIKPMRARSGALLLFSLVTMIWLGYEWSQGQKQEVVECPVEVERVRTHFTCTRHPDYSEICFYQNLCWNGRSSIYMLNESLADHKDPQAMPHAEEAKAIDEDRFRFPLPYPDLVHVPYSPGMKDPWKVFEVSPGHPSVQRANWEVHHKDSVYLVHQHDPMEDPIHRTTFIESNMMLYQSQRLNETMRTFMSYPALDQVYLLRPPLPKSSYAADILSVMLPHNFTSKNWQDIDQLGISDQQWMCFPEVTIVGSKPQFYSGVSDGENWKSRLYERVGLPPPARRGFTREEGFQPTVTIYNPVSSPHRWHISNLDQLIAVVEHYQIAYSVVDETLLQQGLRQNGQAVSNTDVLISPHDEFLVNLMWLSAHATLVELFPADIFNNRYETHARALSMNYRPVRSWLSREDKAFEVPLREFEMALIEAFDLQAVSILGRASQLYVHQAGVKYQENNWNHEIVS